MDVVPMSDVIDLKRVIGVETDKTPAEAPEKKRPQGRELKLDTPEPWPEAVGGAELLQEIADVLQLYIVMSDEQATAETLWIVHTYLMDEVDTSPILAITSPTKRCGKTNNERLLKAMVNRPLLASNITAAAIFRTVEKAKPTLLIDELDTFINGVDELRGILNSGHTKDAAYVVRNVGESHEPRIFSTWASKALAMIGKLPETLQDRSVEIRLSRKRADEQVLPLRTKNLAHFEPLRRKIARFGADIADFVAEYEPALPAELNDRAADNWEPLLAIADAAGGEWPEKARRAALVLSGVAADDEANVMLLQDLAAIFEEEGTDRLPSAQIVEHLITLEGRPWAEWRRGRPLSVNGLARLLKPFGVRPRKIRMGLDTLQGYRLEDLQEPFSRYIPRAEVEQPEQTSIDAGFGDFQSGTENETVPDVKRGSTCDVPGVPDENPEEVT